VLVLVKKNDQTLADLSCVSPTQGLFSEAVSDSQAFVNETEDQMDAWLDTVIAAQKNAENSNQSSNTNCLVSGKAPSKEGKELCPGGLQPRDHFACGCRKWV